MIVVLVEPEGFKLMEGLWGVIRTVPQKTTYAKNKGLLCT